MDGALSGEHNTQVAGRTGVTMPKILFMFPQVSPQAIILSSYLGPEQQAKVR